MFSYKTISNIRKWFVGNSAESPLKDTQKYKCIDVEGAPKCKADPPNRAPDAVWIKNVAHTGNLTPFLLAC